MRPARRAGGSNVKLRSTRHAVGAAITLSDENAAPNEFRIFAFGEILTSRGTFIFDKAAAKLVMAQAAEWGNRFTLDYEHATFDTPDPSSAPALSAGSFIPELRSDGLWASDVRWTTRAAGYLANKEYLYFSPAFDTDAAGHVTRLWNIALTNLPATHAMTPLVTAGIIDRRTPTARLSMSLEVLYGQLADTVEERYGEAAIIEATNDTVIFRLMGQEQMMQAGYTITGEEIALAAEAVEVRCEYTPVPGGLTMKTVMTLLGLIDNATETQAFERVTELQAVRRDVLALAEQATPGEALGVLRAATEAAKTVVALTATVAALEGDKRAAEMLALLDAGQAEGKLTPATRAFWAPKDPVELRAYLAVAPKLALLTDNVSAPGLPTGGKNYEDMSDGERHDMAVTDHVTLNALRNDAITRGKLI